MPNDENVEHLSEHEKDLDRLEKLRLIDDDFFSEVLNGKIDAVQFIINTILERTDLIIESATSQVEYKSATKRSITLDIKAQDAQGRVVDIEIQRANKGAGVHRARFHSSIIDRSLLQKGSEFDDLVDTYVIFITENDIFKAKLPMYHIERTIAELNHQPFGDGNHIIYVNGKFRDTNHPIGRLMHDFNCTKAADMFNDVLANEVKYFKETEGGRSQMCELLEEMREEAAAKAAAKAAHENAVRNALTMLASGELTLEKIALFSSLSLEEVEELAKKHSA